MCPVLCQALGYKNKKTYRNVSELNGEKTCKQTIINDVSTGGMHKGGMGKGAPGKMSREGGTVEESSRGQTGGECSRLKEIQCKHNVTMDDQRWAEHGEMCSRSLSRREKRKKICISYACS